MALARLSGATKLAALVTLLLAACQPAEEEFIDVSLLAMATTVDLRLSRASVADADALLAGIESELQAFSRDFYAWNDGELATLNAALNLERQHTTTAGIAQLLTLARDFALASERSFDPGIGRLVELWGLHDGTVTPNAPPAPETIASVLASSASIADLAISGTTITLDGDKAITLDLGGIAKGAAVDTIAQILADQGIGAALINAGGDLRVIGQPQGRSWRIGVQAPREAGLLGTIELKAGEAAFSSGDYERYFEQDEQRFHHILDPRTGYPATHTRAITVIAANGTLADAAATALFVAGPDHWQQVATELHVEAVLRVDASGAVTMTPAMRDRFEPGAALHSDILIAGN